MPMKGKILILSSSSCIKNGTSTRFDEQTKSFPKKVGDFHLKAQIQQGSVSLPIVMHACMSVMIG